MNCAKLTLLGSLVILLSTFLGIQRFAHALYYKSRIASPADVVRGPSISAMIYREGGKAVTIQATPWPEGVFELVNHPLRTYGEHGFFSGLPNDVDTFDYNLRFARDTEHVLRTFAAIKSDVLRLELFPQTHKPPLVPQDVGAQFRVGNQALMEAWFSGLEMDESGIRIFGVNRYAKAPTACPPTLTLYVGREAVELDKLEVPLRMEVAAVYYPTEKDDGLIEAINQFVATHKLKQERRARGRQE